MLAACVLFAFVTAAAAREESSFPAFSVSSGTPLLIQGPSTGTVVAQGGNYSVPLPDGRTLWLLNNIWTGEIKPGGQAAVWGIIDGGAAISPSSSPYTQAGSLAYVSDEQGWPLPLLSGDLKEYSQVRKFWPRSGLCSAVGCYVFYSIMNNYGPEPYDYFRVGQGIALAQTPEGPYSKARLGPRYAIWSDIEPAFGSAVFADEDGWVYVYGRSIQTPGEYGAELARVKPENLASREKYSYYSFETASGSWTEDISEASMVIEGIPDEFSVSYNSRLKSYLAVYYDAEGGRVLARRSRYPWGPWDKPAALLTCGKEDYCYGAKEQPGFSAGDGRIIFITVEKKNSPYIYKIVFK
ncbi:MAG: hypothetical protein AUJ51_01615 [Elusimicrobia bacterium CG1_02_56_21]|nr:MAG: hypothetical protein AUJ51_01615 [Elusimicrobia bacterium CG1_02_56_21]